MEQYHGWHAGSGCDNADVRKGMRWTLLLILKESSLYHFNVAKTDYAHSSTRSR